MCLCVLCLCVWVFVSDGWGFVCGVCMFWVCVYGGFVCSVFCEMFVGVSVCVGVCVGWVCLLRVCLWCVRFVW